MRVLCTLFLMAICGFGGVFADALPYEQQMVEAIDIQLTPKPQQEVKLISCIKSRMKTHEGDYFSQAAFDNDLKMLAADYDRVEPSVESKGDKLALTIKLWPKPLIRHILWKGNCKLETNTLKKELQVSSGTLFDRQGFNKAFHKVKAYYVKKGFFEVAMNYKTAVDPVTNEVDITIEIEEGRAGKIQNIRFCNFTKDEEDAILNLMITKKYNFFMSWLTDEGLYKQDCIDHDKYLILDYLQNEGYADATLDLKICESKTRNRIDLVLTVDRGKRYYFSDITMEGNTLFTQEQLLRCLTFRCGEPYSPTKVRESVSALTDMYGKWGYLDTFIEHEPKLQGDCGYAIAFHVDEGEPFYVGLIKVIGNCTTQTRVILHESLLCPGERFDTTKLKTTEERLRNVGFFGQVNVYAVKTEDNYGEGRRYRDVHIEVEEKETGRLSGFFGFSTTDKLYGGVSITEQNFNYEGLGSFWKNPCALKGGGEYAHLELAIGSKSRRYTLSWAKPYFRDTPWVFGFELERSNNRYLSDDYNINADGLRLYGNYEYNTFLSYGVHYRIKNTHIDVSKDAGPTAHDEQKHAGLISAVGTHLLYNSTDHLYSPTKGFRSKMELEIAGLGGKHHFLSLGYLNSYYVPVTKGVLIFRTDIKFIQPFGNSSAHNLPLDERYFLGGEDSVRGYRAFRLGPLFHDSQGHRTDDPSGGISYQLYSTEYAYPLFSRVGLFAFVDGGFLSDKTWRVDRPYCSWGFGTRVQVLSSGPPITVGMGFPIHARDKSDVKRFFLTIGGCF